MYTLALDVFSHTGENGMMTLSDMMRNSDYTYGPDVVSLELMNSAPNGYDSVKVIVEDHDTLVCLIADYCDDLPENITQDDINTFLV